MRSTRTGVQFDPLTPYEAWQDLGSKLALYTNATSWWLGDWLAFGQAKYGRRYKDAITATGLDYQTLRNYAVVARRFDVSRRRDTLTFQHHAEVCSLPDDAQDYWLDRAVAQRWSRNELRRHVRAALSVSRATGLDVLRVSVEHDRAERWRRAAELGDAAFDAWIVQSLDAAAATRLTPTPDPSSAAD